MWRACSSCKLRWKEDRDAGGGTWRWTSLRLIYRNPARTFAFYIFLGAGLMSLVASRAVETRSGTASTSRLPAPPLPSPPRCPLPATTAPLRRITTPYLRHTRAPSSKNPVTRRSIQPADAYPGLTPCHPSHLCPLPFSRGLVAGLEVRRRRAAGVSGGKEASSAGSLPGMSLYYHTPPVPAAQRSLLAATSLARLLSGVWEGEHKACGTWLGFVTRDSTLTLSTDTIRRFILRRREEGAERGREEQGLLGRDDVTMQLPEEETLFKPISENPGLQPR